MEDQKTKANMNPIKENVVPPAAAGDLESIDNASFQAIDPDNIAEADLAHFQALDPDSIGEIPQDLLDSLPELEDLPRDL